MAEHPFAVIDSEEELEALVELLERSPWLRAAQVVSSLRVTDEGSQRGYGAQLVFQSAQLSSQPLELRLGGILEMVLEGAEEARIQGAMKTDFGFRLHLRGGRFSCETIAYRMLPGRSADAGAMH